jgi:hypothetical protein
LSNGDRSFENISLIAFYTPTSRYPHLVFPCEPNSPGGQRRSRISCQGGIYTIEIDFPCPLLQGWPFDGFHKSDLAYGEYLFILQGLLFATNGGVNFQQAKVFTFSEDYKFDLTNFGVGDSLTLIKANQKFAIYGANWLAGMDPFGPAFGLMGQIGKDASGVSVATAATISPPTPPPSPNSCIATGLVLDRSPPTELGGPTPTHCPGYALRLTGGTNATLSLILGHDGHLTAEKLALGGGITVRCTVDPNIYGDPLLDGNANPAPSPALLAKKTIPWIIELDGVDGPVAAPIWNETIAQPFLRSIHAVDDGRDLSFMPLLTNATSWTDPHPTPGAPPAPKGSWNLLYRVQQLWGDTGGRVGDGGTQAPPGTPARWRSPELLALVATDKTIPRFNATAEFPNAVTHGNSPVRFDVAASGFRGWKANQSANNKNKEQWFCSVAYAIRKSLPEIGLQLVGRDTGAAATSQVVRMGALDLDFGVAAAQQNADIDISVKFDDPIADPAPGPWLGAPLLLPSILFTLPRIVIDAPNIPLAGLLVGGQDPVPDEMLSDDAADVQQAAATPNTDQAKREQTIHDLLTRDPALAFSPGSDNRLLPPSVSPYLVVLESTDRQASRRLSMRIRTVSQTPAAPPSGAGPAPPATATTRVYVIDTDPFTVAEISMPQLGVFADGEAAATDGEVANWQTTEMEGARWQLGSAAGGFELRFPAQATGEAMEKGQPWPAVGLNPSDGSNRAIDYRLGPPSRMKVQSSYYQQRYAEAPWNLRRILGYPGQRDPGAAVNWLRFELLYGLSGFTWADNMRITELSARIGSLPGPLIVNPAYLTNGLQQAVGAPPNDQAQTVTEVYNQFRQTTARFVGRFRTRLGLYEYRQEGGAEPFALSDKINYLLRLPLNWGNADWNAGQADLADPLDTRPAAPGLAGGALWGIESKNIRDSITAEPHAVAGLVSRLAASALGGSGAVQADFANGKSRIKAEVSHGRTETYIVEQIGRIGVFWNVAKHVIVYERTVLPSDQFAANQPVQDGRPLPRKIAEYIELIQPRRCYPESGQAVLSRGFVEAANFPVPRIPVDGAWGRDTATGWAIPLWKADADPDIYPKPVILLELAAGAESAAPSVLARFKDPSQLTFFTSTLPTDSADTDAWAPVATIDFENAPAPAPAGRPNIDRSAPDMRLPGEPVRDALYDRTTFDIDASGLSADLAAGRAGGDRIGAVIETVTMMRARPRRDGILDDVQKVVAIAPAFNQVTSARSKIGNGLSSLLDQARAIERKLQGPERTRALEQLKADVRNQIAQAKADLAEQVQKAQDGKDRITKTFQNAADILAARQAEATATVQGAAKSAIGSINDAVKTLEDVWKTVPASTEIAQAQLRTAFQGLTGALDGVMVPLVGDALKTVAQFRSSVREQSKTVLAAASAAIVEFQNLCAAVKTDINNATTSHDYSAAISDLKTLLGVVANMQARFNEAVDRLESYAKQLLTGALQKPADLTGFPPVMYGNPPQKMQTPTIDQCLKDARAVTSVQAAGTAVETALAALTPTGPTLPDPTGALNAIGQAIGASNDLVAAVQDLGDKLAGVADALEQFISSKIAAQWPSDLVPLTGAAEKLIKALNDKLSPLPSDVLGVVRAEADKWTGGLTTLTGKAQQVAGATVTAVNDLTKEALNTATDLSNSVTSQLNALQNNAIASLDSLAGSVQGWIDNSQSAIVAKGQQIADSLKGAFPPELDDLQRQLKNGYARLQGSPTFQDPDGTLRLLRAAGAAPIVPNLSFNKDRLAYFFDDAKAAVQTSPAVALLNRAGDDLKALGIRVPTGEILDRVIPASLQNYDFGSLFPDLAGLKLDNLFQGFHLPALANDHVKVTHGFDQARLEAWAKVAADVPFGQKARVFAIGPVEISVVGGDLNAEIDVSIDASGKTTRASHGEVKGNWQIGFGGMPLITFVDTLVHFEDHKGLSVNIQPDKVQLDPSLQFLTDILDKFSDPDSGFHLDSLRNPETGAFQGIMATLDLPLPPIAAGAFAVSNLRFSTSFGLSVVDDFALVVSAAIGRQKAPFSILVAFFTGGGWIEATARYVPAKRRISARVTLELVAGVGVDFSFGPCRGYVYIQFGTSASYDTGGPGLSVSVILLIYGGVDICGLIDINISLMLSITYDGNSVIGRGELDVSIKICWCVTIDVNESITYNLTRGGSSSSGSSNVSIASSGGSDASYLDMFG